MIQQELKFRRTTDEQLTAWTDYTNPVSPLHNFIGNDKAKRIIGREAFTACQNENHACNEAFFFKGGASCGKTTFARIFGKLLQTPFVELIPKQITTLDEFYSCLADSLMQAGLPLIPLRPGYVQAPTCIVFVDEAHDISKAMIGGLLKATEFKDRKMQTEQGIILDCKNICWIFATTENERFTDGPAGALATRLTEIELEYLTKADIAKIVKLDHSDLDDETCNLVAFYCSRVPRKALEFARAMKKQRAMKPGESWKSIAATIAHDNNIDQFGMGAKQLIVLEALGQAAIPVDRLIHVVRRKWGCSEKELKYQIMPWLSVGTVDQPALVEVGPRGYIITDAGRAELSKRGIAWKEAA